MTSTRPAKAALILALALVVVACDRANGSGPRPGEVEAYTAEIVKDDEANQRDAMRKAEARGRASADASLKRLDEEEKSRVAEQSRN
jgi:hypothetical protein